MRPSNISEDSFMALMDALGFLDVGNDQLEEVRSVKPDPVGLTLVNSNSTSHDELPQDLISLPEGKLEWMPSTFDEAVFVRQQFHSDYNFGSDLGDDFSNCENVHVDDTIPSRYGWGCDTVKPPTIPSRKSANLLPAMTRPSEPPLPARPLALYLPDGVAFPTLADIHSPTPSTISSESSSCYSRSSIASDLDSLRSTPDSTVYTQDGTVYVKVAFNATIIMLRASRWISFAELKQRLYDKFVKQERVLLSPSFSVISVRPPNHTTASPWTASGSSSSSSSFTSTTTREARGLNRSRSSGSAVPSTSTYRSSMKRMSVEPRRVSFAERTEMHFIDDEADWRRVLAIHRTDGSKVTLRILDTPI